MNLILVDLFSLAGGTGAEVNLKLAFGNQSVGEIFQSGPKWLTNIPQASR